MTDQMKIITSNKEREVWKPNSANCNICRNFENPRFRSHRLSSSHQRNLTERLRIIRSKIKMISEDSISVHDEGWNTNEQIYCYFCDISIVKHMIYENVQVEGFGYLTHLASLKHMKSVEKYLKYHARKEKPGAFCKTQAELNSFVGKILHSKQKYLTKMEHINQKDVMKMKEIEEKRKILVLEAGQASSIEVSPPILVTNDKLHLPKVKVKHKIFETMDPPWLNPSSSKQNKNLPIIGPTMDTLLKHVNTQKKRGLPVKRIGAEHKSPTFSGVWNKHRRK